MDNFQKESDVAKKWNLPLDQIVLLCESGDVEGAYKFGSNWWIPSTSIKPEEEAIEKCISKVTIDLEEEEKIANQRNRTFNGLTAKEWAGRSRSVWNDVSSTREKKHLDHGATYPEKLCDRLIEMYSREGDTVLDPFLGTGTTVLSAIKNRRMAIGIELTDRFYSVAENEIANRELELNANGVKLSYQLFKGDCTDMLNQIEADSVQLTITSPPYANLIHMVVDDRQKRHKKSKFVEENNATTNVYSMDQRDLGNMDMTDYLVSVEQIMKEIYRTTKEGGYNIWVVKDFRDTRNGIPYVDLHSKIANAGEKAGFKYHDLIIWDQNERRKLVLLGYPSVFYVNQNHSYMVVMRK